MLPIVKTRSEENKLSSFRFRLCNTTSASRQIMLNGVSPPRDELVMAALTESGLGIGSVNTLLLHDPAQPLPLNAFGDPDIPVQQNGNGSVSIRRLVRVDFIVDPHDHEFFIRQQSQQGFSVNNAAVDSQNLGLAVTVKLVSVASTQLL